MMRVTVTETGTGRILGNFKKLIFNLPKAADRTSKTIANNIVMRARRNLVQGIRYKRHMPGLVAGTTANPTSKKGQWVAQTQAFAITNKGKTYDYAPYVEYGAKAHPIPDAFGIKGFTIQHPGIYMSMTKNYFGGAVNETRGEEKNIAKLQVGKAIKLSGL